MGEWRENKEIEINIYTLLCIKHIINKDLLHSTRNCTQYLVIICIEKECEKHKELSSVLCDDLEGWVGGGEKEAEEGGNICICTAETNSTL